MFQLSGMQSQKHFKQSNSTFMGTKLFLSVHV